VPKPFTPRPLRAGGADRPSAPRPFPPGRGRLRYTHGTRTSLATEVGLGCAVVRRVADHERRVWSVREMGRADTRASTIHVDHHTALLFRCEEPGVRSEIRRASRPLESLSDDDLRGLLHHGR